jgi:fibrillarin-like rRNA methylase
MTAKRISMYPKQTQNDKPSEYQTITTCLHVIYERCIHRIQSHDLMMNHKPFLPLHYTIICIKRGYIVLLY